MNCNDKILIPLNENLFAEHNKNIHYFIIYNCKFNPCKLHYFRLKCSTQIEQFKKIVAIDFNKNGYRSLNFTMISIKFIISLF